MVMSVTVSFTKTPSTVKQASHQYTFRPNHSTTTMSSSSLQTLTAQYPILTHLASFLSTLDLYHLSLTSKHFHSHILASKSIFNTLKRSALCDGRGLKQRQNFEGPYRLGRWNYIWGKGSKIWADEPIEVRLWNLKCDEAGALPCRRCGVNVCEECRRYRREPGKYG